MNAVTETRRAGIDPRGPRFGAALTSVLLVCVILFAGTSAGTAVLSAVVVSFLLGAVRGVSGTWQGALYRSLVRPRLGPPPDLEDPGPPRFAQLVGFVITCAALVLDLAGLSGTVPVLAGLALAAAFANAAFGFCVGCHLYLLGRRVLAGG